MCTVLPAGSPGYTSRKSNLNRTISRLSRLPSFSSAPLQAVQTQVKQLRRLLAPWSTPSIGHILTKSWSSSLGHTGISSYLNEIMKRLSRLLAPKATLGKPIFNKIMWQLSRPQVAQATIHSYFYRNMIQLYRLPAVRASLVETYRAELCNGSPWHNGINKCFKNRTKPRRLGLQDPWFSRNSRLKSPKGMSKAQKKKRKHLTAKEEIH